MRLDLHLSDTFKISRNKAQFAIAQNKVKVGGILIKKPWYLVKDHDVIELISEEELHYVARSAFKLQWLLEEVWWNVTDAVCLDIWASTGGFSQILLENNVAKIYAVDVGTSQLHEKIRQNAKIVSRENTDIRDFAQNPPGEEFDIIVCDVSFISLKHIIDSILVLKKENTKIALLYKPQYEVGRNNLTKKWIPKSQKIVEEYIADFLLLLQGKWVKMNKFFPSKLEWESGNKEYFIIIE